MSSKGLRIDNASNYALVISVYYNKNKKVWESKRK